MKTIKEDTLEFPFVIAEIQAFLEPVFDAIVNENEQTKRWNSSAGKWLNLKEGEVNRDKSN